MAEQLKEFQRGKAGYEGYLNDKVAPLPELLRDAGYKTYMSGKWHLGLTRGKWPVDRGFDRSYSLLPVRSALIIKVAQTDRIQGAANHYGYEPQLHEGDRRPKLLKETNVFYVEDDQHIEPHDLGADFYSTDAFADKLIHYLESRTDDDRKQPFFSYLAFSAPHWPLQAPEADISPYRSRYDAGPEALRQERLARLKKLGLIPAHAVPHDVIAPHSHIMSKHWSTLTSSEKAFSSRTMETYAGMVSRMDTKIGDVLASLRKSGELDNTLVIFMSDNGAEGVLLEAVPIVNENIFEHIEKYYDNSLGNVGRANSYVWYGPHWASASTAPARLYKAFTAEGGIRVPLILNYGPLTKRKGAGGGNVEDNGGIEHSFATVMDITPTILELAGATHPGTMYKGRQIAAVRGKSWIPFLSSTITSSSTDPSTALIHPEDTVTGWELFGRLAVRKGKWKACFIPAPYGPEKWQLFDLGQDPGETDDLAEKNRPKLKELLLAWSEYVKEVGVVGDAPEYGTLIVD